MEERYLLLGAESLTQHKC